MIFLFALYHFNDVDHGSPVIYKLLERGHRVHVVLLDPDYSMESDPRLAMLARYPRFHISYVQEILGVPYARFIFKLNLLGPWAKLVYKFRDLLLRSHLSLALSKRVLTNISPDVCVFPWGGIKSQGRSELTIAAKKLGIKTVVIPHGLSIFLNSDHNPTRKKHIDLKAHIRQSYNEYDLCVFQSVFHMNQEIDLGLIAEKCLVAGSSRYCPEWQAINQDLQNVFVATDREPNSVKVVFMLPHWDYNVDRCQTLALIKKLAYADWIHLIVKTHTRGDDLPDSFEESLFGCKGFEIIDSVNSVSLIRWSDVVISFGSSIGLEALIQRKLFINPSYLQTNETIFEDSDAGVEALNIKQVLSELEFYRDFRNPPVVLDKNHAVYRTAIYGDGEAFDVLERYASLLEN